MRHFCYFQTPWWISILVPFYTFPMFFVPFFPISNILEHFSFWSCQISCSFPFHLCSDSNLSEASWVRADLNVQLIKYISVGPGGIFASQAKDDTVWCRYHMQSGKATTKVNMDEGKGHGWNKIANVSNPY